MDFNIKHILVATGLMFLGKVVDKVIEDNLPDYKYKEIKKRWTKRIASIKFWWGFTKGLCVSLWLMLLLKLAELGIIKFNKKTMFVAIALLLILVMMLAFHTMQKTEKKDKK